MTSRLLSFLVLVAVYEGVEVAGYSSGAPTKACNTMTPEHEPSPNNIAGGQRPYVLDVPARLRPGQQTTIRLHGAAFKGFMVRVLDGLGNSGGVFKAQPRGEWQAITCQKSADTATHNGKSYNSVDLTWQAPTEPGTYRVMATIVQEYTQFYTGYYKDVVVEEGGGSGASFASAPQSGGNHRDQQRPVHHQGGSSSSAVHHQGLSSSGGLHQGLSSSGGLHQGLSSSGGFHQGFSSPGFHQGHSSGGFPPGLSSSSGFHQGLSSIGGIHQGLSSSGLHQGLSSHGGRHQGFSSGGFPSAGYQQGLHQQALHQQAIRQQAIYEQALRQQHGFQHQQQPFHLNQRPGVFKRRTPPFVQPPFSPNINRHFYTRRQRPLTSFNSNPFF